MAKERERKHGKDRRHADEEWGKRFGKRMERFGRKFGGRMGEQGRDFGEEFGELGERFGKRVKHKGREWKEEWEDWRSGTIGLILPLIGSIFGLIFLTFGIWVLNFINLSLKSYFITQVSDFLLLNLFLLFAFSLYFGYADYFHKRSRRNYWMFSPIVNALAAVFVIWISIFMLNLINFYAGNFFIELVVNFLRVNFVAIFVAFLVLGYAFELIKKIVWA